MSRYLLQFLAFFFIAACAASALVATRYWGLHESDERGLLRYQIEKIATAPRGIDTVFVGDSTLGNAIDPALFDALANTRSLSLPLTGVYGYAGSYNMLLRALDTLQPKRIVIFHSADLLLRPTEYDGLAFTLYKSWPSYLGYSQQLALLHKMLEHLTTYKVVGDTLTRLYTGNWDRFSSSTDYPVQQIKGVFQLTQNDPFSADKINHVKLAFLRQIAGLCAARGLSCTYVHGPLHEHLVNNSAVYYDTINKLIMESGLAVACPLPMALPNDLVGDSYDHVAPSERGQATQRYADVLKSLWKSEQPDCSLLTLKPNSAF